MEKHTHLTKEELEKLRDSKVLSEERVQKILSAAEKAKSCPDCNHIHLMVFGSW